MIRSNILPVLSKGEMRHNELGSVAFFPDLGIIMICAVFQRVEKYLVTRNLLKISISSSIAICDRWVRMLLLIWSSLGTHVMLLHRQCPPE